MTEEEVKNIVEQIVRLEEQSDNFTETDNFGEASVCLKDAQKREEDLGKQGFILGEDGEDMLVYRAGPLHFARSTWLIFDRANWQWRKSNDPTHTTR